MGPDPSTPANTGVGVLRNGADSAIQVWRSLLRRPAILAASVVALLHVVVLGLLTPGFQTNDDAALLFIVSGVAYGEPDAQAPFTNILITSALKLLYSAGPGIPWYGLYLSVLLAIALAATLYALLVLLPPRGYHWGVVAAIFLAGPAMLILRLQFTSVAILLGSAGVFLHIAARSRPSSVRLHALAGLLLGGASLVRWGGLEAALAIGAPLVLLHQRWRLPDLTRTAVFGASAVAIVLGGLAAERVYQEANPAWQEYREYNSLRGQLHGTPRLELNDELREVLDSIGWTATDLHMFRNWFFTDKDLYSAEALTQIVQKTEGTQVGPREYASAARDLIGDYRRHLGMALAGALILAVVRGGRRAWLVPPAYIAYVIAVGAWLAAAVRLPYRVALPLVFVAAVGALLAVAHDVDARLTASSPLRHLRARSSWVPALLAAATLITSLATVPALIERSEAHQRQQASLVLRVRDLLDLAPDATYVNWAGSLNSRQVHPLRPIPQELRELTTIGLGWRTHSPGFDAQLRALGITDLPTSIAEDPSVLLISSSNQRGLLEAQLERRYRREGSLRQVHEVRGTTSNVYDILVED